MIYHFSISAVDNIIIHGDFQKYTHSAYFSTKNRKSQIMTKKWNIGCGMGIKFRILLSPPPLYSKVKYTSIVLNTAKSNIWSMIINKTLQTFRNCSVHFV